MNSKKKKVCFKFECSELIECVFASTGVTGMQVYACRALNASSNFRTSAVRGDHFMRLLLVRCFERCLNGSALLHGD